MTLSLDKINASSPYQLVKLSDLTFRFVTDHGIHYRVGFYQDTLFLKDEAYHPRHDEILLAFQQFLKFLPTHCHIPEK